jgi:hypothetical protein
MLTYDKDDLYVAFVCYDREPEKISAFLTPRDQYEGDRSRNNDSVTLILDTFNDQRTSYSFRVNPKGVQKDDPGDYLWQSAAQIMSHGWQAELRIPFKSIRFPENVEQVWGVNFERFIFRLQETDYFTQVGRDDVLLDMSATLTGIKQVSGGKSLEFFPYTGFRKSQFSSEELLGKTYENEFAVGLDARYALSSNLTLDLTMSPDFSEVESDPFFFQLSPYEVELQEQRPFFQESNRFFPQRRREPSLFYSKRITNPRVAGKITGRQGRFTIGAIGSINKEDIRNGYIGAFSVQSDIFKFSKIGAMFSAYSTNGFRNQNGNVNFDLKLSQVFTWEGTLQWADNSDIPSSQDKYFHTSVDYEPDEGWTVAMDIERVEREFKPRAGIWQETDQQRFNIRPGYRFRLNKHGIKELELEWFYTIEQSADGTPLGYMIRPLEVQLSTLRNHSFQVDFRLGRTKVQLERDDGLYWSDQYFDEIQAEFEASYDGSRYYQYDASFQVSQTPVYNSDYTGAFDGRAIDSKFSLSLHPTSTIKFTLAAEYVKQTRNEDGLTLFEGAISGFAFDWQITRSVIFNTNLQHNSFDDRMKIDFLLGIELGLGKIFSISYKSSGAMPITRAITGDDASTLLLKASYLLRI